MQIGEAELHTGFFPDSILFDKMNAEYERKDLDGKNIWDSIPQFCNAYKFNEDGIAQEIQEAANAEIRELRARAERLQNENARMEDVNENLLAEVLRLTKRVDMLTKRVEEMPTATLETTENDALARMKADMFNSLLEAAHEGHNGKTVLHMIFGFDFLLAQIACGGVADD